MWPFKPSETRDMAQSQTFHFGMPRASWTEMTVQKAVKDGYSRSGWVYRAVSLIMQSGGSVPWVVYNAEGEIETGHPLSAVLKKPNPQYSRSDVFELLLAWGQLAGNGYLNKVKGTKNRTIELWPFSPDRIAPVASKEQGVLVAGYTIDKNSKKLSKEYTTDNIIHFKLLDPSNPIQGIGPLMALAKTVDIDVEQQNFNKAASQNRGVIDTVISFKKDLVKEQYETITAKIKERITGSRNARKPMVIGSEAKVQRLGLTPAEMDFIESRKMNREEIFIVFGVPPQLAGVQDSSTYNNYSTSKRIFWDITIVPLLDDIASTLNMSFADELGDGYSIGYDVSDVSAMRENEAEKATTAKVYFDMGVPVSNLNKKMDLGVEEFENWDKPWSGGKQPAAVSESRTESGKKKEHRCWDLIPTEFRNVEDEQARRDEQAEGWIKEQFETLLNDQRDEVFAAIEKNEDPGEVIKADHDKWLKTMRKMATMVAVDFAGTVVVDERGNKPNMETRKDSLVDDLILDYLLTENAMLQDLANLEATTADKVIEQVLDAVTSGLTATQLQDAILDTGVFSPERALMLSRTLAGTAASIGQLAGGQAAGATTKEWMDSGFNVRDLHIERNGETAKIDGKFPDKGYGAPRYPLDPTLEPAERINCRCSMTFSYD